MKKEEMTEERKSGWAMKAIYHDRN